MKKSSPSSDSNFRPRRDATWKRPTSSTARTGQSALGPAGESMEGMVLRAAASLLAAEKTDSGSALPYPVLITRLWGHDAQFDDIVPGTRRSLRSVTTRTHAGRSRQRSRPWRASIHEERKRNDLPEQPPLVPMKRCSNRPTASRTRWEETTVRP